jgi:hypothetical protein
VNITNNSAAPGILVSGTHQQVGDIDGSGTTQVDAGSDLTASRIMETALAIGGTSMDPGSVTIAASDASGDPLESTLVAATSLAFESPLTDAGNRGNSISEGLSGDFATAPTASLSSSPMSGFGSVPEPSSLILIFLAVGSLVFGNVAVRRLIVIGPCHFKDAIGSSVGSPAVTLWERVKSSQSRAADERRYPDPGRH